MNNLQNCTSNQEPNAISDGEMPNEHVDALPLATPDKLTPLRSNKVPAFKYMKSVQEVYAFAAMIMASLPFPPMPVCVNQGEDKEDGMASSFDIFQQAIIAEQARQLLPEDMSIETLNKKYALLEDLQNKMQAHYASAVQEARNKNLPVNQCTYTNAWIEQAYNIYTSAFRNYVLSCYPVCTSDLRFFPLSHVDKNHTIMKHALSHIANMCMQSGISRVKEQVNALHTFKDVIHFYAVDLGSLQDDNDN